MTNHAESRQKKNSKAADEETKDSSEPKESHAPPPEDRESITEHTVTIAGQPVRYQAAAGTFVLRADDGKPRASIFYVAYARHDVDDPGQRPITFVFNGGPGSSSVWLHLGLFGPRRVRVGDATTPQPPPYRLIENEFSLLDYTDLVFIDPVSTGYSRPAPGEDEKQFHGVKEDVEAVGEFIRLYTTRARRWESPKFIAGESYGTTRAAALAHHLQERLGLYLNGVMLISTILYFQTARPDPGNDLPYVMFLPTFAATARYHGKAGHAARDLEAYADEVEAFALGDYASLLLRGSRANERERRSVANRLARYTGLSPEFLERADLRITPQRFFKELLRDQRRTVGRLDSRFTGIDADAAGEQAEYDPSYSLIQGPYTAGLNHYVRSELRFESDLLYEILNGERVRPWNWKLREDWTDKYLDVASNLRQAMSRNRALRVFLASGYYDVATPYLAAEWTLEHMGLDPSLLGNITTARYEAGHMMYIHEPSFERLRGDLLTFYDVALPSRGEEEA